MAFWYEAIFPGESIGMDTIRGYKTHRLGHQTRGSRVAGDDGHTSLILLRVKAESKAKDVRMVPAE